MARAGMTALLGRVRKLINDPSGASQKFTDDDIQESLDRFRDDVRMLCLTPQYTVAPGGTIVYHDYYVPNGRGDWEADVVLQYTGTWATLSPDTSDLLTGHWSFIAGQLPDVYLTGKTYDVYAAAADLLREWAALEKLNFDGGQVRVNFMRSQKFAMLNELAAQYERKRRPVSIHMVRKDVAR